MHALLRHEGAVPCQMPSGPQVLVFSPTNTNPLLQLYLAVAPLLVSWMVRWPFVMKGRNGQPLPEKMKFDNSERHAYAYQQITSRVVVYPVKELTLLAIWVNSLHACMCANHSIYS